jgi:hypothetical protein
MRDFRKHEIVLLSASQSFLALIFYVFALARAQKASCEESSRITPPLIAGLLFAFVFLLGAALAAYYFWKEDQHVSPFAHLGNEHIEGGVDDDEEPFA